MMIPVKNIGSIGIVSDVSPEELPLTAWSAGQNIRFRENTVRKAKGWSEPIGTPTVVPYWLLPYRTATDSFWVYAGLEKVYVTDGTTHTNITRQPASTISLITTGNPTPITTTAAHNLNNGETVTIAGVTGNTPDINGTHVATVTGGTTLTIPVNTTVAGTGGTVAGDFDYSATADINWTGLIFGGIPIINNGIDAPQQWSPPQTSTKLAELANWPSPLAKCGAMRGFKQFLIALNYTNASGDHFPRLVKWSHASAFNSVPSSWDETDDTKDAGEYELADTRGDVLDGLAYRDSFLIYKDDSIWGMNFIGGGSIFRFYEISLQLGILGRRCTAEWERGHFVFGTNDIVITDGQTVKSIVDRKVRSRVYNAIDPTNYGRSFVVPNLIKKEMWACYPSSGSSYANQAMVWNWEENSISFRDLPEISHANFGVVNPGGGNTFDSAVGTFNENSAVFDDQTFNPTQTRIMMAGTTDTKLYLGDDPATNTQNGTNMFARVERTGLFDETAGQVKYCRGIYPKMTATGPVSNYVGSQMAFDEAVMWKGPFLFNPATDYKIDCEIAFRWMGIRVESDTNIDWSLTSYELDVDNLGWN